MSFFRGLSVFFVFFLLLPFGFCGWLDWLAPTPKVFMVPFYPKEAEFDSVSTIDFNGSVGAFDYLFVGTLEAGSSVCDLDGGFASSVFLVGQYWDGGGA